ncbi:hypothetical protein COU12_01435 [Candidatus Jorgensenbacteria bacterium CG10_big_fil_rev_8_21_14_0_10_54_38]|uniref:DNA polymerase III delta N-terminal domain-containing protein n=2 Tax=Candidatus Joergenseniibacteriota TaxID=1752739 RepID=A0A2M6WG27_9BACT|nr:MAG: hypothetical protein COX26_00835 [Candidatus Jorgensenbacteria bacterium CG23_combo_of_CG06-09_8_20_14_all_54_14]PIT91736.1 MAG: hypothetical protein COU12_01435 [Candidatus Jorgensenbacteria bacterium CG10_big_fil_rev_8_21_14_0_10_54_38]
MLVFLYGPDGYRRTENLRALVAEYRAKYPMLDLLSVDLEDTPDDWMRARDFLNQPSMFAGKKMLVARGGGHIDEKRWIKALKKELAAENTLVLISDGEKPLKALAFLLKLEKPSRSQEFKELEGRVLELFMRREAEARDLKFSPDALSFFLSYLSACPDRSARAVNELDRFALALRAVGPELRSVGAYDPEDWPEAGFPVPVSLVCAEELIWWTPSEEVFQVARRMLSSRKNIRQNLALLERLLATNDGARIFNSMAYQAGGEAAERFADYDISIKSGGLEYEEALTEFVIGK